MSMVDCIPFFSSFHSRQANFLFLLAFGILLITGLTPYRSSFFSASNTLPAKDTSKMGLSGLKKRFLNDRDCSAINASRTAHPGERQHVAFVKVHKAASSTMHNILARYSLAHDLNIMARMGNMHINQNSDKIAVNDLVKIPPGEKWHILCSHLIFNHSRIAPLMPDDTVYIGILREPFSQFLSAFIYYTFKYSNGGIKQIVAKNPDNPIENFMNNTRKLIKELEMGPKTQAFNNRMAIDFGFPVPENPDDFEASKLDTNLIKEFVQKIASQIDFMLISDMFDESLVLLKRMMKWQTKDILYTNVNVFKKDDRPDWVKRKDYPDHIKTKFRTFAAIDIALYDFFLRKFMDKVKAESDDFYDEVDSFKELLKAVSSFCAKSTESGNTGCIHFPGTRYTDDVTLSTDDCALMSMEEMWLTDKAKRITLARTKAKAVEAV